eukprot:scaffold1240_cov101-Isochrysis_galbana.AAC.21
MPAVEGGGQSYLSRRPLKVGTVERARVVQAVHGERSACERATTQIGKPPKPASICCRRPRSIADSMS